MSWRQWWVLGVTRNGQKLWDGPYPTPEKAWSEAGMLLWERTQVVSGRVMEPGEVPDHRHDEKYPFGDWFDGQPHLLVMGRDWSPHLTRDNFGRTIRDAAARRGLKLSLRARGMRKTVVTAYRPGEENPGGRISRAS